MPQEPLFNESERVSTVELPAELRGVTDPSKIAAYYQKREANLRQELTQRPPVQQPRSAVTIEQRVDTPPQAPAVFSQAEAEAARTTLIQAARNTAMQGKKWWNRLSGDIEKLIAPLPPEDKVNVEIWNTCYNTLVGMNIEKLQEEERTAQAEATRIAAERSSTAPPAGESPAPLPVEVTAKVLPGLGISEAQYREGADRISKGVWPLTAENISGKTKRIGER